MQILLESLNIINKCSCNPQPFFPHKNWLISNKLSKIKKLKKSNFNLIRPTFPNLSNPWSGISDGTQQMLNLLRTYIHENHLDLDYITIFEALYTIKHAKGLSTIDTVRFFNKHNIFLSLDIINNKDQKIDINSKKYDNPSYLKKQIEKHLAKVDNKISNSEFNTLFHEEIFGLSWRIDEFYNFPTINELNLIEYDFNLKKDNILPIPNPIEERRKLIIKHIVSMGYDPLALPKHLVNIRGREGGLKSKILKMLYSNNFYISRLEKSRKNNSEKQIDISLTNDWNYLIKNQQIILI